ncbi:neprilysin-2-like [Nasonia vitripennis]|uniref:Uncharacterized protein n=1 Tax=Nasonia vitripennis TaxID=7425 RepID=A0A7M7T6D3_NASVI|nr:neprilysin-2-like [Nasonia vitripennis]
MRSSIKRSILFVVLTIGFQLFGSSEARHLDKHASIKGKNPSKTICETPTCISAATSILESMDTTVNPCDDFYKFACGSFVENSYIPDDKSKLTMFDNLNDKLQVQLRSSIEDGIKDTDPRSFKLLQSYFKTCMNKDEINKNGNDEYLRYVKNFGNWPVLAGDLWQETDFDWLQSIYQFRRSGYSTNYLIGLSIEVDMKNNKKRVITLDQTSLGLSQEFLRNGFDDKNVKAYYEYMVEFATLFGADGERAKKELKESLDFEIKLAKISLPLEERRDAEMLYHPFSIKQVQSKYTSIPWAKYLNEILKPHTSVAADEVVIVAVPSFLADFEKLIQTTPKRILANYLLWRVSMDSASFLGDKVQAIQTKYEAVLTGKKEKGERWKTCLSDITYNLYVGASAIYVRKYFDKESKHDAEEMIENLQKSFKNILLELDWMDEKTKKAALEKVDWIAPYIAYPNEFFEDQKLDDFYKDFEVVDSSYLKTKLNFNLFQKEYSLGQLRKPVDKTDWISHARSAIVNAFYEPNENSIQFPAGILQGVFFDKNKPKYLNYGAIGSVMGHEITHGFDDQGSQFSKDGNLVDWWEKETKEKYLEKAKCIIDQYSNYTAEEVGLNLNGVNTQGENIADNGGMKESYFAYREWEKKNGVEPRLPGLHYTSQQMFWINAANVYCSKFRPEALRAQIITNVHSPGEFRVKGPMSNNPEFAKDFNCPLGSNMNPVKKCTVW